MRLTLQSLNNVAETLDVRYNLPFSQLIPKVLFWLYQPVGTEAGYADEGARNAAAADGETPRTHQGGFVYPDDTAHIALYGSPCDPHHQ